MINDMLARGLSPKNARETFNNLNAAMNKAHVLKMVRENPCMAVELPRVKRYYANVYNVQTMKQVLGVAEGKDIYLKNQPKVLVNQGLFYFCCVFRHLRCLNSVPRKP